VQTRILSYECHPRLYCLLETWQPLLKYGQKSVPATLLLFDVLVTRDDCLPPSPLPVISAVNTTLNQLGLPA